MQEQNTTCAVDMVMGMECRGVAAWVTEQGGDSDVGPVETCVKVTLKRQNGVEQSSSYAIHGMVVTRAPVEARGSGQKHYHPHTRHYNDDKQQDDEE